MLVKATQARWNITFKIDYNLRGILKHKNVVFNSQLKQVRYHLVLDLFFYFSQEDSLLNERKGLWPSE